MGKYRGKRIDNGEWVYGSLVVAGDFIKHMPAQHTPTWIVTRAFGNGGWFNIRGRSCVIPATVGQFCGLKDKNGVDIFEGDNLECNGEILTVEMDYGSWILGEDFLCNLAEYHEVIGNIHDEASE
jgi:hypothetical protein